MECSSNQPVFRWILKDISKGGTPDDIISRKFCLAVNGKNTPLYILDYPNKRFRPMGFRASLAAAEMGRVVHCPAGTFKCSEFLGYFHSVEEAKAHAEQMAMGAGEGV